MKLAINRAGAPATNLEVSFLQEQPAYRGAEERPVSFILPGGPGADHTAYLDYACLKSVTDLVFHDPRGCGLSDRGERASYTMNNYIDDVEAIRQHFNLDKINLIGKSFGSMCALGYAIRYPHAVRKLVLCAGAPSFRFLEFAKKNLLRQGSPEQIRICEKLMRGELKNNDELMTFFQLTRPLYSVKMRQEGIKTNLQQKIQQFSLDVMNEGFKREFWHFDYENEMQSVLQPTLILAGKEDWVNDVRLAELMVSRIPHSELHVFDNASHAMEIDVGNPYFQLIADFIARR